MTLKDEIEAETKLEGKPRPRPSAAMAAKIAKYGPEGGPEGRRRKNLQKEKQDKERLLDLLSRGYSSPEIGAAMQTAPEEVRARIDKLKEAEGVLLKYRETQSLHLTKLQYQLLEAITPDKIAEAPLSELVKAYRVLKDKELVLTGQPTDIKGLVGYLVELEAQDVRIELAPRSQAPFRGCGIYSQLKLIGGAKR